MSSSSSTGISAEDKLTAIEQFCTFTGAAENRAKVTLEACNWNIELAVNMHVDGIDTGEPVDVIPTLESSTSSSQLPINHDNNIGGSDTTNSTGTTTITTSTTTSSTSSSTLNNDWDRRLVNRIIDSSIGRPSSSTLSTSTTNAIGSSSGLSTPSTSLLNDEDSVRPPIPPVRQVLVEDGFHNHRPRNHTHSVFDGFRNLRAETRWLEEGESATSSANLNKRRTLEELFRPPLDLMFRGPMDQARDFASSSNKWLMVNLQNVQEFACQVLNRDLWSNPAVKEIISEHFIFWQIYHDSYEGSKYMQFYSVTQFPYIAILDPRTGEKMRSWSNTIDAVSFCEVVTEFLMEHPSPNGPNAPVERLPSLPISRRVINPNPYEETEEMQLRAAIAASLEENRKMDTSNVKTEDSSDESELETFDSDTETGFPSKIPKEPKKEPLISDVKVEKPPSPESWEKYLVPESPTTADITIRFPDGKRERKAFPSQSPLKILFLYISSKGYSMNDYDLVIHFPKKNLSEFSDTDTLSSAGLCPGNNVFVHMKSKMSSSGISGEDKQAAIEQFCTFTGTDENFARVTLEACNWDIELAVNMHVDGIDSSDPVDVIQTHESSTPSSQLPSNNESTIDENVPTKSTSATSTSSVTNPNNSLIDPSISSIYASSSSPSPSTSTTTSTNAIESTSGLSTPSTSLLNEDDSFRPSIPTPRNAPTLNDLGDSQSKNNNMQIMFESLQQLRTVSKYLDTGKSATSSGNNTNNKRRSLEELFRPPLDLMLRASKDQPPDSFEDAETPGSKRTVQSASTSSESDTSTISASPPRFMALEEIMKAANEVCNMCLAHEIVMDDEFKLEKNEIPPNSFHKKVDDMMRKVFWKLLQNELDESPPNYKRALMLLSEIKENLMSFLLPQHTRLKQEIEEILDLDLIKQQAENGALDFQRYAHYILSVMARLCAPIRDEKIRQLTQTREVVPIFRGIMELLDEMRLDMANFLVQQIRPQVLQQSVTYERKKFTEFLKRNSIINNNKTDPLEFTKKWLKRAYDEHNFSGESIKEIINKVLTSAYVQLLIWDGKMQEMFPETLVLDEKRIISLRDFLTLNIFVGSALLVTVAAFPCVQSLSDLKENIRDHLLIVLDEKEDTRKTFTSSLSSSSSTSSTTITTTPTTTTAANTSTSSLITNLESRLESAALQIIADIKKHAENHVFPDIDSTKELALKAQIVDLKNENNRIRQIVQKRILEFVESVFTSNTASPVQMPKGLTALQRSLSSIAGQFMRIASHNRAVYGTYYANIINDLVNGKL
ncbi:uncharacterized protein LOC128388639 [Panonychus citri]|uniref:uncharacterized protein LOC128388639 n=1 Tax=Panonychus citri TaxID=50023 RepID=UPI002307E4D7|nr:uncharacterized protein LOC128388639 [Panonychus citri]